MSGLFGAIEAGGTKFVCTVAGTEDYLVPPGLGRYAGALGAIALAQSAITR